MTPATEHALGGLVHHSLRTILVVEDEELICMILTEVLQDHGYHVFEAANVADAKQILSSNPPIDLVFSDINMPGTETGFALSKWVHRNFPNTKVLLTSGAPHSSEDTKDLSQPIIQKPYSWVSVLGLIESQL